MTSQHAAYGMRAFSFGIEIEVVGIPESSIAKAIHRAVNPFEPSALRSDYGDWRVIDQRGRAWRVVYDGSLRQSPLASGGSGEIVSPILGYSDIELVHAVVRSIRDAGARADWATGIHVHVGADSFGPKQLRNLVHLIRKQERLLEHALGIHASRIEQYCKSIDDAFFKRLAKTRLTSLNGFQDVWYGERVLPTRGHRSRYHGLNLNSVFYRRTIEFRYFNGSVDEDQVKAYIHLVLALAARAITTKAAGSGRREFRVDTAKYDWRVFLNRLGLKGPEFKTTRAKLTQHLAGSAAWKGERRDRAATRTAVAVSGGDSSEGERQRAA
jgi:hypothetical protein